MESVIQQFIWEVVENTLQDLKATDRDYAGMLKDLASQSKKASEIYNCLQSSDREVLENYDALKHKIYGVERTHIYTKGFKDCTRMMNWLK